MSIQQRFQSILDRLQTAASLKTVFGEPVKIDGKTIIPVAKVAYAFGMCSCDRKPKSQEHEDDQDCGGGGGGVAVRPAGVIEITPEGTRFVPTRTGGKVVGALFLGVLLGIAIAGKRSKKE